MRKCGSSDYSLTERVLSVDTRHRKGNSPGFAVSLELVLCRSVRSAAVSLADRLEMPVYLLREISRRNNPRFEKENLRKNLSFLKKIEDIAAEKKCTTAQLALAWVVAQGKDIVPIPGTKRRKYLEENVAALEIELTLEDLARINEAAPIGVAVGDRYNAEMMKAVNK